ncbi:MAG: glycoside hydrolase family 38 C-terminal domain-containing protein [Candidatus Omnitrophota bacterium]
MLKSKKIFVVPYCHADWAWTHTRLWHEKRYDLVFNEVLDLIKKHPEFRWYLDNYICELKPFLKYSPERIPELKRRIEEGKVGVCGGFANVRTNMVGEETFIRNLILGRERFQELFPGVDLSVHADTVDVAVGHPQLPQILTLAGYKYFRFWRPFAALSAKKVPLEFVWRGLDGSKIITSRGSYSGLGYHKAIFKNFQKEVDYAAELSPTGVRWLSQGTDDCRPLRTPYTDFEIPVFELFPEWRKKRGGSISFGTPLEYFQAIEKERMPEVSGTLDPCDVCYNAAFGGSRGLWRLRSEIDRSLREAETWSGIARNDTLFQNLWEKLFIVCSHATQWLFQNDFDEIYSLAINTKYHAEQIRDTAIQRLSQEVSFPEDTVCLVFNHLPFATRRQVSFLIASPVKLPGSFKLKDGRGKEIPCQVSDRLCGFEAEVLAEVDLPAVGYNIVRMVPGKRASGREKDETKAWKQANGIGLENRSLRLKFQAQELVRVEEKIIGNSYTASSGISFGQPILFEVDPSGILHVGKIRKRSQPEWFSGRVVTEGPLRSTYRREGKSGHHPISQDISIFTDRPLVEFKTRIDWQGMDGFLALFNPLPFKNGKIFGDIPFGVEEKKIDAEPYGDMPGLNWDNIERLRTGMFFAKSFVDYTDGFKGMALISKDGDRYFLFDRETLSLGQILVNGILDQSGWEKYVNYQRKAIGEHTFTDYLYFHSGDWKKGKVYQEAEVIRSEPSVIYSGGSNQKTNKRYLPYHSFLTLKPDNLILTAFYREDDHFICRFYETGGRASQGRLTLPFLARRAIPINLLGEEVKGRVEVKKRVVNLRVRPWQVLTLKIWI